MASVSPRSEDLLEPSRKRQKVSTPPLSTLIVNEIPINLVSEAQTIAHNVMMSQHDREAQAGILCYVNESNPGFSGILKQRYTDFLVNEVTLDGKVVHLTNTNVPRRNAANKFSYESISSAAGPELEAEECAVPALATSIQLDTQQNPPEDTSQPISKSKNTDGNPANAFTLNDNDSKVLDSYFGIDTRQAVLDLYEKLLKNPKAKPGSLGTVSSQPITDRQVRGKMHQDVRRIFNSQLDTVTDADGVVKISVAQKAKSQGRYGQDEHSRDNGRYQPSKGRLGWQELGGEHLHFSLYKENKDTMEVISYISSQLKTSPRQFNFAGTKDRRGVTVQRVSVHRVYAETLSKLNRTLRGSKVGNFQYQRNRLELGDLMGNEFVITLRNCHFAKSETVVGEEKLALADKLVGAAMENMKVHGFLNYYGLQRFGTYTVGTNDVGQMILQGEFEGAVNAILTYGDDALACALNPKFVPADGKPLSRDDIARAEALHIFKTTGNCDAALNKLPRKFSGETSIIRYMKRNKRDFLGALLQIPRNLRLMYVHAYQSLVWNMAASERWTRYGDRVVKGDLVLVDSKSAQHIDNVRENEIDESGEIIVLPAAGDTAIVHDDLFERARALTAEEAESGKYSIFDIVLPTPGYDIEYPDNDIGDYYKEFMSSERGGGLDPGNMRRAQHDFSLSGSYRKILAQIGNNVSYEIKLYNDDNMQMVETDLEKMTSTNSNSTPRDRDHRVQGDWKAHGDWRVRQRHNDERDGEENLKQRHDWKNFPSELAREEKAVAELFEAQKTAEPVLPVLEQSQPVYNETFIQTSAEHGKRTGLRETTVTPRITADEPEGCKNVGIISGEDVGREMDNTTQNEVLTIDKVNVDGSHKKTEQGPDPFNEVNDGVKEVSTREPLEKTDMKESPKLDTEDTPMEDVTSGGVQEHGQKIAVIVKFQLGSSQYATMALRELMKQGGVQTFKPEFGTGR